MTPEQELMIGDAERNCHRLTDWERNFVDDLSRRDSDYPLSEKQAAVLERINNKITIS